MYRETKGRQMVAGIQELLLLILIVMAIILVPRMTTKSKKHAPLKFLRRPKITYFTGKLRLAIVLSLLWPGIIALYFTPWHTGWKPFVIVGLGPVVIVWSVIWVMAGYKNR